MDCIDGAAAEVVLVNVEATVYNPTDFLKVLEENARHGARILAPDTFLQRAASFEMEEMMDDVFYYATDLPTQCLRIFRRRGDHR